MSAPAEFLTVAEVAGICKVSPATVRRLIRDRRLHAIHLGRSIRISRRELDSFLALEELDLRPLEDDDPFWSLVGSVPMEQPWISSESKRALAEPRSDYE